MGTRGYILKKVFQAFLTLLAVIVFNFFLFRILPADPVDILTRGAGAKLDEAEKAELRASYGLDKPLFPGQFLDFMGDTLRGDLGQSIIQRPGEDVTAIFGEFMWPTLLLVGVSTIVSTVLGIFMGIYAGWRRNGKFDLFSMGFSLVLYSMPEFWLGMLLILLFSTTLGWFPSSGRVTVGGAYTGMAAVADVVNHLFLPALTLTLAYLGEYYLVMRSSLLDVLGEDYITTARAKGVREKWVLRRHAVPNALLPTITLIALSFGFVLGGAITVEVVFGYKGLGGLTYAALQNRDFPLLQGIFLISSATVIGMNLVADLIYGYLDPRVREALDADTADLARGRPGPLPAGLPESLAEVRSPRQIRTGAAPPRPRRVLEAVPQEQDGDGRAARSSCSSWSMAIFAVFASKDGIDPTLVNGPVLAPPSLQYPLGTDDVGVSVLTLVVQGSKISLLVGLVASVITMVDRRHSSGSSPATAAARTTPC